MHPKHKHVKSLKRILKLAEDSANIRLLERGFIVAIKKFTIEMNQYRELLHGLKVFASCIDYIDQIENGLDEGRGWILDTYDGKLEYSQLIDYLVNNTVPELESLLDTPLSANITPGTTSKMDEEIIVDIELLTERYWEDVRKKGYELHSVLTGSI